MDDIKQLGKTIYRDRVRRARATAPEEKLLDGMRLFDFACSITRAGIRHQFPDVAEERLWQILRERLAIQRRLESAE